MEYHAHAEGGMRFVRRLAPLLALASGCGFAQKPYADDPLLRGARGVWTRREPNPPAPLGPTALTPPAPVVIEPPQPPLVPISPRWE